jgi:hypothetical protein
MNRGLKVVYIDPFRERGRGVDDFEIANLQVLIL